MLTHQSMRRLLLLLSLLFIVSSASAKVFERFEQHEKKHYIVYMGDLPANVDNVADTHISYLVSALGSEAVARDSIVHSYTKSFNAFAAKLSASEAKTLSGMKGVVSVFPNRYHKLHTTRSWDFLGFPQNVERNLKVESDIIVGLLDTGITPEAESFNDEGFGPPQAKWKGSCGTYANFSGCNNKIVGAKYFNLAGTVDPADISSPVDVEGHGTHTSSTLAGRVVEGASLEGIAKGVARGAVPSARIAMYKVCWISSGCSDMDLLAGFDAAIDDGVDLISISIGGDEDSYITDTIAIGSFHAMKRGILTSASAGNSGPSLNSVTNHAPWVLTVAASSSDRQFRSKILLGNGKTVSGVGVNAFTPEKKSYPLVRGADVSNGSNGSEYARNCMRNTMDPEKVKGKVVYCELLAWGVDECVKEIGGVGAIIQTHGFLDVADIFVAPGTLVNETIGDAILDYINSTSSPTAVIDKTEAVKVFAPFVASFSSRGPRPGRLGMSLLKPDIAAPGVDILAAYTPLSTVTGMPGDTQYSKFTIMSGTSMACPHVAGVAAYVKSFHPSWSPAAIKSAIMTTAKPMSNQLNSDAEFSYGAGHVNPVKAVHPGLVYDMKMRDYMEFLCQEGYNQSSLGIITGEGSVTCSKLPRAHGIDAINYPTMQLILTSDKNPTVGIFRRRVTNVGPPTSVYNATIEAPAGVEIDVVPKTLHFSKAHQRRSFKVVVKAKPMASSGSMVSATLVWSDSIHKVRSPIVVYKP